MVTSKNEVKKLGEIIRLLKKMKKSGFFGNLRSAQIRMSTYALSTQLFQIRVKLLLFRLS